MSERSDQLKQFVLERTKPQSLAEMTNLIDAIQQKHDRGQLDTMYLMSIAPRALGMIKPDALGEVRDALSQYRNQK